MSINFFAWRKRRADLSLEERIKKSPFRLSLMRWHELVFIILFSLFASIIASLRFNIDGSWSLFFANICLFCSALSSFNVYRIMDEAWREVTMAKDDDPIGGFYKAFNKEDKNRLWRYFLCSAISFLAFIFLSGWS